MKNDDDEDDEDEKVINEDVSKASVSEPNNAVDTQSSVPQMSAEERQVVHENYLRLISEPAPQPKPEVEVMPVADKIDTEKLIYNNKPETERDYRNLINNLFNKTVKGSSPAVTETPVKTKAPEPTNDLAVKAEVDGLKINSTEYIVNNRRKSYNLGGTLLKCSMIIAVIMLLEFILCLLLKNELKVNLAYPFVIFALALAQLAIFCVLYYTDVGKIMRRPSSSIYLTACLILTTILIAIIFLVAILLKVNFTSASEIFSKIIIPIIVALNLPIFAVSFYAFSK